MYAYYIHIHIFLLEIISSDEPASVNDPSQTRDSNSFIATFADLKLQEVSIFISNASVLAREYWTIQQTVGPKQSVSCTK